MSTTNEEASGASVLPTITPDGRYVAFSSRADDLVAKNTVGLDVFVRDVTGGGTVLVDVNSQGRPRSKELAPIEPGRPSLSDDAATAAFTSSASNLAGGDTNRLADVFLRRLEPTASATADRRVGIVKDRLLIVFRSERPGGGSAALPAGLRAAHAVPARRSAVAAPEPRIAHPQRVRRGPRQPLRAPRDRHPDARARRPAAGASPKSGRIVPNFGRQIELNAI